MFAKSLSQHRIRGEPLGVDAGGQVFQARAGAEGRREPAAGVSADEGDHIGVAADVPEHLPRARQHRPPDLVTVRAGDDPLGARATQRRRQHGQRRGRAEPHRRDLFAAHDLRGTPRHERGGEHERRRVPVHPIRGGRVELLVRVTTPARRVDDHVLRRQQVHQILQVGLDPARTGRKVVGEQQRSRHQRACTSSHRCHPATSSARVSPRLEAIAVSCAAGRADAATPMYIFFSRASSNRSAT